jgi:hypothetical protein
MPITFEAIPVRVGNRIHLAAQARNDQTGAAGPLLSAESCQLDDTDRDVRTTTGGELCQRCYAPVSDQPESGEVAP